MTLLVLGFFFMALAVNVLLVSAVLTIVRWLVCWQPRRRGVPPVPVDVAALEARLVELERRAGQLRTGRHLVAVE